MVTVGKMGRGRRKVNQVKCGLVGRWASSEKGALDVNQEKAALSTGGCHGSDGLELQPD
jgi:hypothetical protein